MHGLCWAISSYQCCLSHVRQLVHTLQALHSRISDIIELAARAGVNVLCLQEAWTMVGIHAAFTHMSLPVHGLHDVVRASIPC